jgi:hypothetical protein
MLALMNVAEGKAFRGTMYGTLTSNVHARDLVRLRQIKDKAFSVVVIVDSFSELQVNEALVAARESTLVQLLRFGFWWRISAGVLAGAEEVVAD